jgi:hypothetical protein
MSKRFALKETTVAVRGEELRVREITHAERLQWVRTIQEDKFRAPGLLVSFGTLDPKFTEDEAGELPNDVVTALVDKIMEISGLEKGSKKEGGKEKQPDAGAAVPVQAGSGDGTAA